MKAILIAMLLQLLPLPPRTALENPAVLSPVSQKLKKDYDKVWSRFVAGKEDGKLAKDLDKLLKKEKDFAPALTIAAYIELYKGSQLSAAQKFEQALRTNPKNRIALYYLAELASARRDYARASDLYSQLLAIDKTRNDVETKRQRALLLATEELLRSAERAEQANRLEEAEALYRQALNIAPNEPTFHARFAELLAKEKKSEEAAAESRIAEGLQPRNTRISSGSSGSPGLNDEAKFTELEDLGRWGQDIQSFRQIKSTESVLREQLAALLVRYFPQLTELRQSQQIVTDIQDSWARKEIQTIVGVGLIDPLPNHTFEPAAAITRGELALSLARLIRILGVSPATAAPIPAPDLALTNAQYRDIQLVLGFGLMTLADSGNFNVSGLVSGTEAIHAAEQLLALLRKKEA